MAEMWVNMGPQHPMTHGLWDLKVKVDGETIIDAIPQIGYLHRGIEKICENRKYSEITPLTDRLCYAASMSWSYTYIMTVEELMQVKVPLRAEYIRVIALEMQRIASHLMWLAAYAPDTGNLTMFLYAMRDRELFLDLLQMLTGARLTYNYPRIGGVRNDLPSSFKQETINVLDWFDKKIIEYENMFDKNEVFLIRNQGVGILKKEDAINLGVTGPCLRASGVNYDVRKDEPYSIYDKLDFKVCIENTCDAYGRYRVRMNEMKESSKIIRQCLKDIPEGEYLNIRVPKIAPKKAVYGKTEDPRGEGCFYIVGNCTEKPYRVKIRSPLYVCLSALPKMLIGNKVADVPIISGSIDVCMGEADR